MGGGVQRVSNHAPIQSRSRGSILTTISSEVTVKVVNRHNIEQIKYFQDHAKIVKHLSFDPSGTYLAASSIDGVIYIYTWGEGEEEAKLYRKVDGIIRRLEVEDDASAACVWHPDGRIFACATATRDIATVSVADGAQQRSFRDGHFGDIVSLAWSPNGALLASASRDGGLVLWDTKTQSRQSQFNFERIQNITWNPTKGLDYLNWTNTWGEVVICPDFLTDDAHVRLLHGPPVRSPFFHDPLDESNAAGGRPPGFLANGGSPWVNGRSRKYPPRAGTPDSLDDLLNGSVQEDGEEDEISDGSELNWIEDDDGAGYTNANGKRPHSGARPRDQINKRARPCGSRRHGYNIRPYVHPPFQPGSTPWRGDRRYLCLNLTGFVWTIDQEKSSHHTITVEFYDRESHRDFHFTDPYLYDKACLNEKGALFTCPPSSSSTTSDRSGEADHPACIFYRPHETWTTGRADWRTELPAGEAVVTMALSDNFVTVVTDRGYVRLYTLFGTPYRIWRHKAPAGAVVTCAAYGDFVMIVSNGAVGPDGSSQLVYSIENVRSGQVCQDGDQVALPGEGSLQSIFFSDEGVSLSLPLRSTSSSAISSIPACQIFPQILTPASFAAGSIHL